MPRSVRLLLACAGALLAGLAIVPPPTAIAAKSFELTSLHTSAVVGRDGSMSVEEVISYDFVDGPFTVGTRSFARDRDRIVDFAVSDDRGPLDVSRTGDGWEWTFRAPLSDAVASFTITYTVRDAVRVGSDVADLYWQFLGTDHPGVGSVDIDVEVPGSVEPAPDGADPETDHDVLWGWAHGPANGTIELSTSHATAHVTDVPARTFVEVRLAIPSAALDVTPTAGRLLPGIVADENDRDDHARSERDRRRLGWILAPVVALAGVGGLGALWARRGREPRSAQAIGDYWREPLDDPPAIAAATLHRGTVAPATAMAATLIDLAQRGFVRISAEHEERLGPDRTTHTYAWLGKPLPPGTPAHDGKLVEFLFHGRATVTSDEITAWAKEQRKEAKAQLDAFTAAVRADYRRHHYDARLPIAAVLVLLLIAGACVAAGLLITSVLHNGIGVAVVVLGGSLVPVGILLLRNRTPAGATAVARARGLRKYLKDFSQLDEAPIGHLVLWERYLVFAVALGVSDELVRGLSARLPQVLADPQFGAWYVGNVAGVGRFDHLGGISTGIGTAVSAAQPKSSGSGGGFSGGGGGGGGGGGFGAH